MSAERGHALIVLAAGQARRYGGCKPLAPVGPEGEAVLDIVASDAWHGGFDTIVLVISTATGPAIRYHVERKWPKDLDVRFAIQSVPGGTVPAVHCGLELLDSDQGFVACNADDCYGHRAFARAAQHLASSDEDAIIGFRLSDATIGDAPVTRGVCHVDERGYLSGLDERKQVSRLADGTFRSDDGRQPVALSPDTVVSVNLWVFQPSMRAEFARAVAAHDTEAGENLLPELAANLAGAGRPFKVELAADSKCIGVTHPGDLELVQAELARQVAEGIRPASVFSPPR